MILYLDTSALLKKYFKESGSSEVISEWKKADAIATSMVAYAETMAAVFRKKAGSPFLPSCPDSSFAHVRLPCSVPDEVRRCCP
jgi:PIN domain nuclease of toxin-antitoxin system